MEIETLRGGNCPDGRTCSAVKAVVGAPAVRYVIGKRVTDPAVRQAFATHLGDDEDLVEVPAALLPEV